MFQGWVIASRDVQRESYTVEKLTPNTTYMFLVRAVNVHGAGFPSKVSDPIQTLGNVHFVFLLRNQLQKKILCILYSVISLQEQLLLL